MAKEKRKGRVSKAQWLEMALEVFRNEGEPGIRVELLARRLGISKAGFYWHFRDREDLLNQLLDYWVHEYIEIVTGNSALAEIPPGDRLLFVMNMIYENKLAELDIHFGTWALRDTKVERKVGRVVRIRLDFARDIFLEKGFEEKEADMRARLFVGYESNEQQMFKFKNAAQVKDYRERRWRLLLSSHEAM